MNPDPALAIVVPVRDEADNILPLLDEIHTVLEPRFSFEIIYVDDGSTDATAQRLVEAQARFPRLRVLSHARGCGQSVALHTGVNAAHAPWIVTLDGDGQNDPADIPALLDRRTSEAQAAGLEDETLLMLVGLRTNRRDSALRRISSRIANSLRARLLGDATPDGGCGLKVFSRNAFLRFPAFNHMHRFLPALMVRAGGVVVSVPVHHRPRARGVSKYGLRNRLGVGIVDLFGVVWLQRRPCTPTLRGTPTPKRHTPDT